MKQYFLLVIIFAISTNLYSQFSGGLGTANDPYKITSREDMEELADSVDNYNPISPIDTDNWSKGKHFILMNDITDSVRTVVGWMRHSTDYAKCFQGDFDGNNKKITLAIDGKIKFSPLDNQWFTVSHFCIGLFSGIREANVYDLSIEGYVIGSKYVGGICGSAHGFYENTKGSKISNCINYCNVTGIERYGNTGYGIGGICGHSSRTNFVDCTNYGTVYSSTFADLFGFKSASLGGICGELWDADNFINCTNYGDIGAIAGNVGGVVGRCMSYDGIKNCANYGKVMSNFDYVGGIAGLSGCWDFSNCHNYGDIFGEHAVGGITGCNMNDLTSYDIPEEDILPCILSHCTNSGTITATSAVGGIAGHTHDKTEISHCINIGTVQADSVVGGIASGYDNHFAAHNGTINNCHNSGLVIGNNIVGGIQGRCWGEIYNSLNTGVVIGNTNAGGIAGEVNKTAIIENCYYDKQMCIHGGIVENDAVGQAEGYLTKELIGNNLQAKLGNTDWTFNSANLYPTLKHFENDSVALVASSPVYLYDSDVTDFDRQNRVRTDFKVNLENDVKWNRSIGNVDITNEDGFVLSNGSDTLVCSIGNYKKLVPINIQLLPIGDVKFTIWATEHKQIAPSETNYNIPIYIKSNAKTLQEVTIKKLVIEIDKDIFYAKYSDNGTLIGKNQNEITIENIKIPALNAGEEVVLFNLIGDVLLGNIDSSEIIINQNIELSEILTTKPDLKNGYLTLNICHEGSDRFIGIASNSPSLFIKNNPVEDILEVECNVLERGKYTLEVVDMAGRSVKVEEFVASGVGAFQFELNSKQFGIGSYILIMKTHNKTHSVMFSIVK